ncbi:hypothetical protein BGZ70_006734, partial [Mortierella alpina]
QPRAIERRISRSPRGRCKTSVNADAKSCTDFVGRAIPSHVRLTNTTDTCRCASYTLLRKLKGFARELGMVAVP